MTPLRILHVTPYYAPALSYGGVVTAVTGLATAQAERGNHVTVLTTDAHSRSARNPVQHEVLAGVDVIRCRNLSNFVRARFNLSSPPGYREAFRALVPRVDVVHVHELRTVENLLMGHDKPIILSAHGTLPYGTGRSIVKRGWDSVFGRLLLGRIDHVAALTANEVNEAQALWDVIGVPFPGASIIPNGVATDFDTAGADADGFRARYALGSGPVVLFLGRLHERKGLQFLILAFAQAAAEVPEARLLVVGPDEGMQALALALAAQMDVADRVVFTGLLGDSERRAALAAADIFALPAVGEGLSMAALEAMSAGLPLVLTPGCNLPDLESHGAGLLVPRAVEPLTQALRTLLCDPARRKAMGAAGQTWVSESFTWPIIAAQTERMYRQVLV